MGITLIFYPQLNFLMVSGTDLNTCMELYFFRQKKYISLIEMNIDMGELHNLIEKIDMDIFFSEISLVFWSDNFSDNACKMTCIRPDSIILTDSISLHSSTPF